MVLQSNNYKIIQKVQGQASATYVFGIPVAGVVGGGFKPLIAKARSKMLDNVNMIGHSRAIINETVEVNDKFFLLFGIKTVTVSAYVIEFTNANIAVPPTTETSLNSTLPISVEPIVEEESESIIEILTGKWIRQDKSFEISFDGDCGVFSQITSGQWFNLLKKDKVSIGDPMFKDISNTGALTWGCRELREKKWIFSILTLNPTGDSLTVRNEYYAPYILIKVKKLE